VPVKGDMFARVIHFLKDLSIVDRCEEEGWNDLSDKTLQTLHVHFRSLIHFQSDQRFQNDTGMGRESAKGYQRTSGLVTDNNVRRRRETYG
jgi:hypothetical protein